MTDWSKFDADPELPDDYDPEFMEEMFQTFKALNWTPADITTDPKYAELYAEWLKTHTDD